MNKINIRSNLSYKARTADFDRYLCALFAKRHIRESLFSLILFNSEIAKISNVVSEPTLGHIRLQWWRDAIEGIYRGDVLANDIVAPLFAALKKHNYTKVYFHQLIDGRALDLQANKIQTMSNLTDYAEQTSSPLLYLFLETMRPNKATDNDAIFKYTREVGISWALTGLIRAWPYHCSEGHIMLPSDLLENDKMMDSTNSKAPSENVYKSLVEVGMLANSHLEEAARIKGLVSFKEIKVIRLLAMLCKAYLDRLSQYRFNPYIVESSIGPLRKQILLSRVAFLGF